VASSDDVLAAVREPPDSAQFDRWPNEHFAANNRRDRRVGAAYRYHAGRGPWRSWAWIRAVKRPVTSRPLCDRSRCTRAVIRPVNPSGIRAGKGRRNEAGHGANAATPAAITAGVPLGIAAGIPLAIPAWIPVGI
jgi:hypothetical protein